MKTKLKMSLAISLTVSMSAIAQVNPIEKLERPVDNAVVTAINNTAHDVLNGIPMKNADDTWNVTFPDLSKTYLATGTFAPLANLKQVGYGQTYSQVRLLLGNPHFSEGIGSPKAYNYIYNMWTNQAAGEFIPCQYQVQFDNNRAVKGTYWVNQTCASLLNPAPAPVAKTERINIAADALFQFNRSSAADLLPAGRNKLDELANKINSAYARVDNISLNGYTDRLGSDGYNMALSQARANTVRSYLQMRGVNASMTTAGQGKSNPVTTGCMGSRATPALTACLQPDRRVTVDITGIKK